ncbi:glycosyltransferase family 9 protein [candidate division WOR-3 bacterium]|nr:glycosyltransferase family 9 protein [candidate division WOR-3 bacterium]
MRFVALRYGQLGDVVLLSSLIESISKIENSEFFLGTREIYSNLFRDDPRVKGMFFLKDDSPRSILKHAHEIKMAKPDVTIDAHLKTRTLLLSLLIGAKTVRYDSRKKARRRIVKTKKLTCAPFFVYRAYTETLLKLGFENGILSPPKIIVGEKSLKKAREIIGKGKTVAIHLNSSYKSKIPDVEKMSELSEELALMGYKRILLGPEDSMQIPADINLLGKTGDLSFLAALLKTSSVLVTNDSGPLHLAEAVGTPVAAIFCSTSPAFGFMPWKKESFYTAPEINCHPCTLHGTDFCRRGDFFCTKYFTPKSIAEKVSSIFENRFVSA